MQTFTIEVAQVGSSGRVDKTVAVPYEVFAPPDDHEVAVLKAEIKTMLVEKNAVLVSHYYTAPEVQDITDETGGCVADSLEMARFGRDHPAQMVVVSGVKFMGETAKILSPQKTVVMPHLGATCSLDVACPADAFAAFCALHPDHEVVVYANTSAEVKALADWVVTSSIAVELIQHLHRQGKKILWAPDKHLGDYLQRLTGAEMVLWQGACVVHDEFKARELAVLKQRHPQAKVLVHPESPAGVIALADVVGSTSQLLHFSVANSASEFIVATDSGILHKMRSQSPHKAFMEAPTAGTSATCKSCSHCPWMAMNELRGLRDALRHLTPTIELQEDVRQAAEKSLQRMLDFAQSLKKPLATAYHQPQLGAV